jgi:hypothetical protein
LAAGALSAFVKNADRVLVIVGDDDFGGISGRSFLLLFRFFSCALEEG